MFLISKCILLRCSVCLYVFYKCQRSNLIEGWETARSTRLASHLRRSFLRRYGKSIGSTYIYIVFMCAQTNAQKTQSLIYLLINSFSFVHSI